MLRIFIIILLFGVFGIMPQVMAENGEHKILHMPPQKIAEFIEKTAGDKRVILIYTSWCPQCRKLMPKIMDIENIRPGSIIAISEDDDHVGFVKYINKYKDVPFMIFLSKQTKLHNLNNALQEKFGAKPWSAYPHLIFLDAENNIIQQGSLDIEKVAGFLLGKE